MDQQQSNNCLLETSHLFADRHCVCDLWSFLYVNCLLVLFLDKMGRGFIVEDAVEGYLSHLCEEPTKSPCTGLLIGQVQRKCSFRGQIFFSCYLLYKYSKPHNYINIVTLKEKRTTINYTNCDSRLLFLHFFFADKLKRQ